MADYPGKSRAELGAIFDRTIGAGHAPALDRKHVAARRRALQRRRDYEYAIRQVERLEALSQLWDDTARAMLHDEHKQHQYVLSPRQPDELGPALTYWRTRARLALALAT
ncbi:hypothetical protein BcepSauron_022 [Burkholderia phage BcepSauron]|uniref:Uncharacterized protein n=1 Tax=Burkholderia phage BcepSauron TaxID=2530033 RepID=A0A482MMA6_9CAUD|nr:hypothetical protein H1O17_gp022 [Burkholderia phage BcepSauron]QBQ74402.1 hypothetical protein BcepSauron_022 [Burkholderia phage BcepSauron]